MPAYFQRLENALKRANEFLEVDKKQPALDVLYDVMKSKKHRTWQNIQEPIMLKYLELCVDLLKSHLAKEGLYRDDWDDRRRDLRDRRDDRDRRGPPLKSEREVSSWRRTDDRKEDRAEERDTLRHVPPPTLSRDPERYRERESEKDKAVGKAEKEKDSLRRAKNETDEDGWTTVRS